MNKLYLVASEYGRFHSELGVFCPADAISPCEMCGYPNGNPPPVLRYFWDTGFGLPQRSISEGHNVFWCELAMLISSPDSDRFRAHVPCFGIFPTECMASDEAAARFLIPAHASDISLEWLKPVFEVTIDDSRFPVCRKCGKFSDEARRVSRLHFRSVDLPGCGIFQIKQNRGNAIFATENGKRSILEMGLSGVAFYPAGRVDA